MKRSVIQALHFFEITWEIVCNFFLIKSNKSSFFPKNISENTQDMIL